MTDLGQLTVSLTKHGAHKIAELLKAFPAENVLDQTRDKYQSINIDRAQAEKNLSVNARGEPPAIWNAVRELGDDEIENLVFLAIVFSHGKLIEAMTAAVEGPMFGRVVRDHVLSGKAYTNFAHIIDQLGFAVEQTTDFVAFDLRRLFLNTQLAPLARELLRLKLLAAGWSGRGDLGDECLRVGLNDALGIEAEQFSKWINGSPPDPFVEVAPPETIPSGHFVFSPGHKPKKEGETPISPSRRSKVAMLLHNEMQTAIFEQLVAEKGANAVGTENTCGSGSVDIVVKERTGFTFYELKTSLSVRECIREALGQLIDYGYWPDQARAISLVIVSPNKLTKDAARFLDNLRARLGLPIFYQQFDRATGSLRARQ